MFYALTSRGEFASFLIFFFFFFLIHLNPIICKHVHIISIAICFMKNWKKNKILVYDDTLSISPQNDDRILWLINNQIHKLSPLQLLAKNFASPIVVQERKAKVFSSKSIWRQNSFNLHEWWIVFNQRWYCWYKLKTLFFLLVHT